MTEDRLYELYKIDVNEILGIFEDPKDHDKGATSHLEVALFSALDIRIKKAW